VSAVEEVGPWPSLPRELEGLLRPSAYPYPLEHVELLETQLSWVLLAGERVYKLKRPVQYPFVDQRLLPRRAWLCHEEVRLNRRFAPQLYLGVCPITAGQDGACIGGTGPVLDYAVVMRAFDRREQLDQLILGKRLEAGEIERLGSLLARTHRQLPRQELPAGPSAAQSPCAALAQNARECVVAARPFGTSRRCAAVAERLASECERRVEVLRWRAEAGCIRECHADLHLSNVVRIGGALQPYDCLEFDPALRWIDTALDIAFLYADLLGYGEAGIAARFLNAYLSASGDYHANAVLPLYAADRALVRAKVMALQISGAHGPLTVGGQLLRRRHERYLAVAEEALRPRGGRCLLMTGLPGSGKSWLAARLVEPLGAVVLRSDVERKRLAGLEPLDHSPSAAAQGLYRPEFTAQVYERLAQCAAEVLAGGRDVIVDANFGKRQQRHRLAELCRRLSVPLTVVQCEAPWPVLQQRIAARRGGEGDASDADLAVLERQRAAREPITGDEDLRIVALDTTREDAAVHLLERLTRPDDGLRE